MPEYRLNKLVRDKYPEIYLNDNQQAKSINLVGDNLKNELIKKISEELGEINIKLNREELISELADLKQAILDFEKISEIHDDEVEIKRLKKEQKLGGFTTGVFVEKLKLTDDDNWNDYYRKRPDLYPEE